MAERVEVTSHALDRAAARHGAASVRLIKNDVTAALEAGRCAKHAPAWAKRNWHGDDLIRPVVSGDGTLRFVWSEDWERLYIIRRRRGRVVVVTAYPAR